MSGLPVYFKTAGKAIRASPEQGGPHKKQSEETLKSPRLGKITTNIISFQYNNFRETESELMAQP